MERILEPELMEDELGALAYAQSDFTAPHSAFMFRFHEVFPSFNESLQSRENNVVDLGCGTADISIRFAKAYPNTHIYGLDGSEQMLKHGSKAREEAGLPHSISLLKRFLPNHGLPLDYFDAVISNSLLHHLPDGKVLWQSAYALARLGSPIFVVDLTRPATVSEAKQIVSKHTVGAPELMAKDFYNSLLSAYRPEEVRVQLDELGLDYFKVEVISDHHMMIYGHR